MILALPLPPFPHLVVQALFSFSATLLGLPHIFFLGAAGGPGAAYRPCSSPHTSPLSAHGRHVRLFGSSSDLERHGRGGCFVCSMLHPSTGGHHPALPKCRAPCPYPPHGWQQWHGRQQQQRQRWWRRQRHLARRRADRLQPAPPLAHQRRAIPPQAGGCPSPWLTAQRRDAGATSPGRERPVAHRRAADFTAAAAAATAAAALPTVALQGLSPAVRAPFLLVAIGGGGWAGVGGWCRTPHRVLRHAPPTPHHLHRSRREATAAMQHAPPHAARL